MNTKSVTAARTKFAKYRDNVWQNIKLAKAEELAKAKVNGIKTIYIGSSDGKNITINISIPKKTGSLGSSVSLVCAIENVNKYEQDLLIKTLVAVANKIYGGVLSDTPKC